MKLTTDAGHVGIGEAHGPFLFQGAEGLKAVNTVLQTSTPLVVGQDPFDVERIWQDLFALTYTSVRGIPTLARQARVLVTAMSAIDIALWDLKGKAVGRPVYALLGGALRQKVPAYVTDFYYRDGEKPDDVMREAEMYVKLDYRTVKAKVGGLTPEADAERVGRIRRAVGKDVAIMLDANQGWNLPTAIRAAKLCEPHDIFWLEDPMPWFDERHTLARRQSDARAGDDRGSPGRGADPSPPGVAQRADAGGPRPAASGLRCKPLRRHPRLSARPSALIRSATRCYVVRPVHSVGSGVPAGRRTALHAG